MTKRITKRIKRTKSMKSGSKKSRRSRRSKRMRLYKGGMPGRAPASYVGSIEGKFINSNGQQLFRNPAGGIA
jgi:hypothetical protein